MAVNTQLFCQSIFPVYKEKPLGMQNFLINLLLSKLSFELFWGIFHSCQSPQQWCHLPRKLKILRPCNTKINRQKDIVWNLVRLFFIVSYTVKMQNLLWFFIMIKRFIKYTAYATIGGCIFSENFADWVDKNLLKPFRNYKNLIDNLN